MERETEQNVRDFYDEFGWREASGGGSGEDRLFRTFPPGYAAYAVRSEARLADFFGNRSGGLLIVGCGDFPESHRAIADRFDAVTLMDISRRALDVTREKCRRKAALRCESIVHTQEPDEAYDAVLCSHVLFHIDAGEQERAVRQMIRLLRPGGRIVVIYCNPWSAFALPGELARGLKQALGRGRSLSPSGTPQLYYHAYPLRWWQQFSDACRITLHPHEVIGSRPAKALLRGRRLPQAFFHLAGSIEAGAPGIAARLWQYPAVVLDKHAAASES